MGNSAVPTHWEPYTMENSGYLEITKKTDSNSMKRSLKTNFLRYWTLTYPVLPTVTDQEATPVRPQGTEATPIPLAGDSEAAPVPPTDGSTNDAKGTQMPAVIVF
ncbi:Bile salt-activated lipase [Plecturocebus cupreus]